MNIVEKDFDTDIRYLKHIGEKRALTFHKLGIYTVGDLLYHFPRGYEDRSHIVSIADSALQENCAVVARVVSEVRVFRPRRNFSVSRFKVSDGSGSMEIFFYNMDYVKNYFVPGLTFLFFGKMDGTLTTRKMAHPSYQKIETMGDLDQGQKIVPVYPMCAGMTKNMLQNAIDQALEICAGIDTDPLPEAVRKKCRLVSKKWALFTIHKPLHFEELARARRRLAFEELFVFEVGLLRLKTRNHARTPVQIRDDLDMTAFYQALPFRLTAAQKRCIDEALQDMRREAPMSRLLQGDVGSGKTIVAAALCYAAAQSGWQSALMAPTEILAEQHFSSLKPLLAGLGIKCTLLTGSMSAPLKRSALMQIRTGSIDLAVGTHALLQEGVSFARLGFVITDEQHRFGVGQRSTLTMKGENPHMLVMSATPIPRTLSLIIYGDLNISIIDTLPPGRQEIATIFVEGKKRNSAYRFIRKQVEMGRQAYIVCPLVEQSEDPESELLSAEQYARDLAKNVFPDLHVGLIHGKLKSAQKDSVMRAFAENKIHVLVATTVIEVGVNVPNATVMLVENAERFGLSQLHQLRGRVGRSVHKSYCILISDNKSELTRERLETMCQTQDGFEIAQKDLELRGPGDFFGKRQHGLPTFRIANIVSDMKLLKLADACAKALLQNDPTLNKPSHALLKKQVDKLFTAEGDGMFS